MVRLTNKWLFYTSSFKYCTKQFRNYHLMDHWTQSLNELTESVRVVNQHQNIMALSDVIFYVVKWDILYCIQNLFKFTSLFSEFGWLTSKKIIGNITISIILMHESTGQLIQIYLYFNHGFLRFEIWLLDIPLCEIILFVVGMWFMSYRTVRTAIHLNWGFIRYLFLGFCKLVFLCHHCFHRGEDKINQIIPVKLDDF